MSGVTEVAMRWRVRLGYLLVFFYAWLAHPSLPAICIGAAVALPGLLIRGAAAGHLRKHEALATGGPYAFTRNPLYFGSALLALGMVIAAKSWILLALVGAYFAVFYALTMREEERELRERYGQVFEEYAAGVPLFLPRLPGQAATSAESSGFSWDLYRRNKEWQAAAGAVLVILLLWFKLKWM